jgi:hypothetical protein
MFGMRIGSRFVKVHEEGRREGRREGDIRGAPSDEIESLGKCVGPGGGGG